CKSDTPAIAIAYGQTLNETLTADCESANFDFAGQVGDLVTATYLGPTYGQHISLKRAGGDELGQAVLSTVGAVSDVTLPATETCRVTVDALDGYTGPFSILLYKASTHTAAITPGVSTGGSISVMGRIDEWTFNGTSGQICGVDVS